MSRGKGGVRQARLRQGRLGQGRGKEKGQVGRVEERRKDKLAGWR